MTNDLEIVLKEEDEAQSTFVTVPIKKKDFGDFITNLLGQRELIEGKKNGPFVIDFGWFIHMHHMLDQRITQQHSASLVDFSAILKYKNGSHKKLSTAESFLHFIEAKKVRTASVKITWTYLISFPQKKTPEKQEITLNVFLDPTSFINIENRIIRQSIPANGLISYSIAHTERTWGDDIETLLTREIDSVIKKSHWYDELIGFTFLLLALSLFISGLLAPDYVGDLIRAKEINQLMSSLGANVENITNLNDSAKLSLLVKLFDPTHSFFKVGILYKIASFIFGIFASVLCFNIAIREKPSYLIITSEDKEHRECQTKKKSNSILMKILAFIGAISAGVAGNYVYYLMNISS